MKSQTMIRLSAVTLLLSIATVGSAADKSGSNVETEIREDIGDEIATLMLGRELAKHGLRVKNPISLAVAANLIASVRTVEVDLGKKKTASLGGAIGGRGSIAPSLEPEDLLGRAREIARESKAHAQAVELAAKFRNPKRRGRENGCGRIKDEGLNSRNMDVWEMKFVGGERAQVFVSGNGGSDLDLEVFDENGNLVARDDAGKDDCLCVWRPKWTGTFTIKVKNVGKASNVYNLYTN